MDAYSKVISESFETRLGLLSGETPTAPPEHSPTIDSNKFWLEVPSLTPAEYLVRQASPDTCDAAIRSIEDALQRAQQHHNLRQVIQFLALKAVALKRAGRVDGALEVLEKTLHTAEFLGFVRNFVDRRPSWPSC